MKLAQDLCSGNKLSESCGSGPRTTGIVVENAGEVGLKNK